MDAALNAVGVLDPGARPPVGAGAGVGGGLAPCLCLLRLPGRQWRHSRNRRHERLRCGGCGGDHAEGQRPSHQHPLHGWRLEVGPPASRVHHARGLMQAQFQGEVVHEEKPTRDDCLANNATSAYLRQHRVPELHILHREALPVLIVNLKVPGDGTLDLVLRHADNQGQGFRDHEADLTNQSHRYPSCEHHDPRHHVLGAHLCRLAQLREVRHRLLQAPEQRAGLATGSDLLKEFAAGRLRPARARRPGAPSGGRAARQPGLALRRGPGGALVWPSEPRLAEAEVEEGPPLLQFGAPSTKQGAQAAAL
mmetsp:Transcript_68613/g.200773  ORF Transcript_68613/g.200773 Transcript_68613/m.200773 type:complete len:308 (+) Transcript_68613:1508-2431(+)